MTINEKKAAATLLNSLSKVEKEIMKAQAILNLQEEILNEENPISLKNQMAMLGTALELSGMQATYHKEFKPLEKRADGNWEKWVAINDQFTNLKGEC